MEGCSCGFFLVDSRRSHCLVHYGPCCRDFGPGRDTCYCSRCIRYYCLVVALEKHLLARITLCHQVLLTDVRIERYRQRLASSPAVLTGQSDVGKVSVRL